MTTTTSDTRAAQLAQAKLFAEVARRVQQPFDALPAGDAARVSLVLWQQAAACAIAAAELVEPAPGVQPASARELLERAAGGSEPLQGLLTLLPRESEANAEPAGPRAALLATFAKQLIDELEQPARTLRQRRLARFGRLGSAGLFALVALGALLAWAFRPPNLVPLAQRRLSSEYSKCNHGECGLVTFHTKEEQDPWVSYDFGQPRKLHSIAVENRQDCCYEQAVPLVVESSDNQKVWKPLAHTEKPFLSWSSSLSGTARYVRLRVAARAYLHLKDVTIR